MIQAERVPDEASVLSFIWLLLALTTFGLSAAVGARLPISSRRPQHSQQRGLKAIIVVFVITALVAFLWIGMAVIELGGIGRMAALASSQNAMAREVLLNAAFPGGRLVATGFIGLSVTCAYFIGRPKAPGAAAGSKAPFWVVLVLSLAYLGVIPIIMSGRVNFFTAIMASYVAACLPNRRFVGLGLVPVAILLLALVWGVTDYFALRGVGNASPIEQATQGLLFYFYNDISNALNPVGNVEGHYAYGWNSLRFIFFFTFTDSAILEFTAASRAYMLRFQGGGEFPLLTAPYVDFSFLGLAVIAAIGAFCGREYRKAMVGSASGTVYAIVAACLILSVHASYLTNHEIVYNLVICALISRFSAALTRPHGDAAGVDAA